MKIESDAIHLIPEGSNVIEKKTKTLSKIKNIFDGAKIVTIQSENTVIHLTWQEFCKRYVLPDV